MPAHSHPDRIARCVIQAFDALPSKYKPRKLSDGRREWVPLAGIVLSRKGRKHSPATDSAVPPAINQNREEAQQANLDCNASSDDILTCAALATGMKCLPYSKLPFAKGAVLHDSHAEILALRAFNRFLLDECLTLAQAPELRDHHGDSSPWVRWKTQGKPSAIDTSTSTYASPLFELRENIGIHMYCSELPCGDASMEQTMSEQADATPWSAAAPAAAAATAITTTTTDTSPPAENNGEDHQQHEHEHGHQHQHPHPHQPPPPLLGRGHFDRLGIVRRKPSRPDAPPSLSKSCSDKLALKQCTSLLSGLLALLLHPARCYLDTLVVPERGCVPAAMERAFGAGGRMGAVAAAAAAMAGGLTPRYFAVRTTSVEFGAAKRVLLGGGDGDGGGVGGGGGSSDVGGGGGGGQPRAAVPSNLSAVRTPARREVLVNGVLQGRKQSDLRGASCLSRRILWRDALELAVAAGAAELAAVLGGAESYGDVKASRLLRERESVKAMVRTSALQGWTRNDGDEAWKLDDDNDRG